MPKFPDKYALGARDPRASRSVPNYPADSPVGDALARAGANIARIGFNEAAEQQQYAERAEAFGVQTRELQFENEWANALEEKWRGVTPETAAGFSDKLRADFRKSGDEFFKTITNPRLKAAYGPKLVDLENRLYQNAFKREQEARDKHTMRLAGDSEDILLSRLNGDFATSEQIAAEGNKLWSTAALSPDEREVQLSRWNNRVKQETGRAFEARLATLQDEALQEPENREANIVAADARIDEAVAKGYLDAARGMTLKDAWRHDYSVRLLKSMSPEERADALGSAQRTGGSRSWRNRNPGNLKYGDFARSMGAVGQDAGGFAIFPSEEAGAQAQEALLFGPRYRDLSINEAIRKYAPAGENDPGRYASIVSNAVGVDGATRLADLSAEQRATMLAAMRQHEGWKPGGPTRAAAERLRYDTPEVALAREALAGRLTSDKGRSHVDGLSDAFAVRLARMMEAAPDGLTIFSGFRDTKRQAELWDAAVKKYGSPAAARKWVAPPGKSQHNHGNAVDLRFASDEARQWAHDHAAEFGLTFPLGNEPWHIEAAEARRSGATSDVSDEPQPSGGDPFFTENIPPDELAALREGTDTELREQESRERTLFNAEQKQRKEELELGILTDEVTNEGDILNSGLDAGDQATLLRTMRQRKKVRGDTDADVQSFVDGGFVLNPLDKDDVKRGESVYSWLEKNVPPEQMAVTTGAFIEQSGYVPKKVAAAIRNGITSQDPAQVASSLAEAANIYERAPTAVDHMDGGSEIRDAAASFRHLLDDRGMSAEQAAQRIIEQRSPEAKRNAAVLDKSAEDFIKKQREGGLSPILNAFNPPGWTGAPEAGFTPALGEAMLADYLEIAREKFVGPALGDPEVAKAQALAELKTLYDVTRVSGSPTLMKFPPEKSYPTVRGSHDYLREAAMADAQEASGGMDVTGIALESTPDTAADIRAGRLPRYRLRFSTDENGQAVWHEVLGGGFGYTREQMKQFTDVEAEERRVQRIRNEQQRSQNEAVARSIQRQKDVLQGRIPAADDETDYGAPNREQLIRDMDALEAIPVPPAAPLKPVLAPTYEPPIGRGGR